VAAWIAQLKGEFFFSEVPRLLSMLSIEIIWIGLRYAKVQKWKGYVAKSQSPNSHKKQRSSLFSRKITSTRRYLHKLVILQNLLRVWRQEFFFKWKIQTVDMKEIMYWIQSTKFFHNQTSYEWDLDFWRLLGVVKIVSR
jgi:hypothetical protein